MKRNKNTEYLFKLNISGLGLMIIIVMMLSFFQGCAPTKFTPVKSPEIRFELTSKYNVEKLLSEIKKPEKMKVIFINKDFKKVPINEASYILVTPKEYTKVAALLKLCHTYKNIILEQEKLVNIQIDITNSLKEFIKLEYMKSEHYKELWTNAENQYLQERYDHKVDKVIYNGTILSIGTIMAILLIL